MAIKTKLRLQQLSGSLDASAGTSAFTVDQRVSDSLTRSYLNFDTTNTVIELGSSAAGATAGVQIDGAVSGAKLSTDLSSNNANDELASAQAIKNYVDGVAQGLSVKDAVRLATTGSLSIEAGGVTPNYDMDTDRITMSGNGEVKIDGHSLVVNDRVLIKNETGNPVKSSATLRLSAAPDSGDTFQVQSAQIASNTAQVATFRDNSTVGLSSTAFSGNAANIMLAQLSTGTVTVTAIPSNNDTLGFKSTGSGTVSTNQVITATNSGTSVSDTSFTSNAASIQVSEMKSQIKFRIMGNHANISDGGTINFSVDVDGAGSNPTTFQIVFKTSGSTDTDFNVSNVANVRINDVTSEPETIAGRIRTIVTNAAEFVGGSNGWSVTAVAADDGGQSFVLLADNSSAAYDFTINSGASIDGEAFTTAIGLTAAPTVNEVAEDIRVLLNSTSGFSATRVDGVVTVNSDTYNANQDITFADSMGGVAVATVGHAAAKNVATLQADVRTLLSSIAGYTCAAFDGSNDAVFSADSNGRQFDLTVAQSGAPLASFAASGYSINNSSLINGVYKVITVGVNGSAAAVFERATDADGTGELEPGSFMFVTTGSANADAGFVMNSDLSYDFTDYDVSPTFTQFSGAGSITAGNGLGKVGNEISLDTTITNVTSLTNAALALGRDADNQIQFATDNQIIFRVDGAPNVLFKTGGEIEAVSLDIGSGGADIDGTLEANAITIGGANILTGGIITSLGEIAQDTVTFSSANADDPLIVIKNTTNDASSSRLKFLKDKGAAASDGDDIGEINFFGDNAAQQETEFGRILVEVATAADGDEAGKLSLMVAESNGSSSDMTAGLVLTGEEGTDGEIDVIIAAGAGSLTTVSGTSQFNGNATFGVDDTGVDVRIFSQTANEGVLYDASEDELGLLLTTKLKFHDIGGGEEIFASSDGVLEVNAGTTLQMTAPTIDLNSATELNIDTAAYDLNASGAATLDATSFTFTSDEITFTSANANDPLVTIENTTADAAAPRLKFNKNRSADAVAGDDVGDIQFWSYDDGTPSVQQYAGILAEADVVTSGEEGGKLTLQVASHDGGVENGLILVGGSADAEVDVTIGNGAASLTTIAGHAYVTTQLELGHASDNTLTASSGVLSIEGKSLAYNSTRFASVIGAAGLTAGDALDTGITTANLGAVSTSSGGALHNTEVYVNGQLLLGGASAATRDYSQHANGAGNLAFEFDLESGDVVQVVVR